MSSSNQITKEVRFKVTFFILLNFFRSHFLQQPFLRGLLEKGALEIFKNSKLPKLLKIKAIFFLQNKSLCKMINNYSF